MATIPENFISRFVRKAEVQFGPGYQPERESIAHQYTSPFGTWRTLAEFPDWLELNQQLSWTAIQALAQSELLIVKEKSPHP